MVTSTMEKFILGFSHDEIKITMPILEFVCEEPYTPSPEPDMSSFINRFNAVVVRQNNELRTYMEAYLIESEKEELAVVVDEEFVDPFL